MAIAFVREIPAVVDQDWSGSGPNTAVLSVPAAGCAIGNTLIVYVAHNDMVSFPSITDTKGNSYVLRMSLGPLHIYTAYLTTALVSGDTISVAEGLDYYVLAGAAEFTEVSPTDPIDATAYNFGGASDPFVWLPASSGTGRAYFAVASWEENGVHTSTPTLQSGWSDLTAGYADPGNPPDAGWDHVTDAAYKVGQSAADFCAWQFGGVSFNPLNWSAIAVSLQPDAPAGSPNAPSGLNATTVSSSAIDLAWTDNSSDETSFRVERSLDGSTGWAEIGSNAANDTTYSDTGLAPGTTYFYRVRARNGSGDSAYSNTDNATTSEGSGSGTAPTAPASLSAFGIGTSRIQLDWSDLSSDETGFKIERSADGSTGWVQVGTVGEDVTSWVNSGLASSTRYYYRVRAYNAAGNSGYTNVATAATLASDSSGAGDCPVERYASVGDVQALIWSSLLAISDSSEPSRATVEDWLCEWSLWLDSTLRWKYVVPVADAQDRERLRPICARLAAADCWDVLKPRNPGMEKRAEEMRAVALSQLVWHPGGAGSWLPGSSSVIGQRPYEMGRAMLVLPNTTVSDSGEAELGQVLSSFTEPDGEGPERLFGAGRTW